MTRTGFCNPILHLEKAFWFPRATVAIEGSFKGEDFKIINDPEEDSNIYVPHGGRGSGHYTTYRYLWMTYGKDIDTSEKIFVDTLDIINVLSLLMSGFYLNTSSLDTYIYPGSLSFNRPLNYPENFIGLSIENDITVSNKEFSGLMDRVNKLSPDDYSYFKSATFLIKEAKKRYYKGENSGAIADAVSAVEALYIRPNSKGFYNAIDPRFGINDPRLTFAFEEIFCRKDPILHGKLHILNDSKYSN